MAKITVKNLTGSPYDVETLQGPTVIAAYATMNAEFTPLQIEIFKASLAYEIVTRKTKPAPVKPPKDDKPPVKPPKDDKPPVEPPNGDSVLATANLDDLRKVAAALGIEVKEGWDARRIQAKIDALLKGGA